MTPAQKQTLRLYLHYRDRPMTFPGILWSHRRVYLLLLIAIGLLIIGFYQRGGSPVAGYFAIAMIALLLRGWAALWRVVQVWPAVREVIDWDKLEATLNSAEGESNARAVRGLISRVTGQFPHLRCEIDDSPGPVDLSAEFPQQEGLSFPVGIHLDNDVIGLYAGCGYHQDFFPASDSRVVDQVEQYLRGLLSGDCRVIERGRRGHGAHTARLEQRVDETWIVRSRWSRLHIPFLPATTRILQQRLNQ